jgi:hypothetical protein
MWSNKLFRVIKDSEWKRLQDIEEISETHFQELPIRTLVGSSGSVPQKVAGLYSGIIVISIGRYFGKNNKICYLLSGGQRPNFSALSVNRQRNCQEKNV